MSSPSFSLRDCRASETRARAKIIPREKGEKRRVTRPLFSPRLAFLAWGDFTSASVLLALLSLRKNEGLFVVLIAATCRGETSQRQIASSAMDFFVWKSSSPQQNFIAETRRKKSNHTEFCDLLRRQNSVADTRSDLSLQCVAATCCFN